MRDDQQPSTNEHSTRGLADERDGGGELGEMAKTALIAVLLALLIRTFLYEPFNIPSGSMLPTLKVGDYLFVSKTAYGYSQYSFPFGIAGFDGRIVKQMPERGDVVVFRLPTRPSVDYIKRVVALPGETVRMAEGRLYIDGEKVRRIPKGYVSYGRGAGKTRFMKYVEVLPGGVRHYIYEEGDAQELDDTRQFSVPEDHVFVMGDNRDHSRDSRVMEQVGFVPVENLVGRADIVFFSVGRGAHFYEVWKWPWAIRYDRLLHPIAPLDDGERKTNSAAMAAPHRG